MRPHMHVTGYSTSPGPTEQCFLQIVEQPRPIYLRARLYGLLESVVDKLNLHKTNNWFDRAHATRCNNDCKWSGVHRVSWTLDDGSWKTEDKVQCGYDPPALRIELQTRYLEFTQVKTLGDVQVSIDEYNRIFFNGRKVV